MADVPFGAQTILQNIISSLSEGPGPHLKGPYDAVAIFAHACMLSVGFRLVGLTEDDRLDPPIEGSNPKPLPSDWNASLGNYGFRYAHPQSSLTFLIKVSRLGNKAVIMGLGLGDDKTNSFDIRTNDFLSESFYPYSSDGDTARLGNGFISPSRLEDLAKLFKVNIVQKLIPSLNKPGYQEEGEPRVRGQPEGVPRSGRDAPGLRPQPLGPVYQPPPIPAGHDQPPGFDDEYEILRPPRVGGGFGPGGRNPLSIGEDDLNPPGLGRDPPLRGPFFGEGRSGGFGGMGGSGGMHPGPDHPMFGGGGGIPNPRAPPGARYDPVGPGDEPMGMRGPRGPFGPGGPDFGGGPGLGGGPSFRGGPRGFGGGAPPNPFSGFGSDDFI